MDICTCPNGLLCIMVKAPVTPSPSTQKITFEVHEYVFLIFYIFFADGPGDPSSTVPSPRAGKSKFAFRGFSASVWANLMALRFMCMLGQMNAISPTSITQSTTTQHHHQPSSSIHTYPQRVYTVLSCFCFACSIHMPNAHNIVISYLLTY